MFNLQIANNLVYTSKKTTKRNAKKKYRKLDQNEKQLIT